MAGTLGATGREPHTPNRLMCPGPTPSSRQDATKGDVYHRSAEFTKAFQELATSLGRLVGSRQPPVILSSSGTGGLEAAIANLTDPGDRIAVVEAGKFGERWTRLGEAYGCRVDRIEVEWGRAPSAAAIRPFLHTDTKALFLQANETSTGVASPLETILPEIRPVFPGLIIVDAISSLGAHPMEMDPWGIDAVCGGSQKGFGVAPGLAFIALSDRARTSLSRRARFYFDLRAELEGQARGVAAFTPAISLILDLKRAVDAMETMGFAQVIAHHARLARGARAGIEAAGLKLYAKECPSHALTAFEVPEGIAAAALKDRLRDRFGMFFAGGQGELKGRILRLAHLGFVDIFHVLDGLAALELALAQEDPARQPQVGDGVKAALQSFQTL